jgi:hypothetical protein
MHTFTFKTLPDLQAYLDRLEPGEQFSVPSADYIHLFGENDAARGRLENCAKGHQCVAFWSPVGVVLRRLPQDAVRPVRLAATEA